MRILFWVPYPTKGASNRYRVEQYLPYLKKADIKYSLRPFWSSPAYRILYKSGYNIQKISFFIRGSLSRLFDLLMIFRYDIVFIHREAYPLGGAFLESIISILEKPIIYDFDDPMFLPAPSRPNGFIEKFKRPDKIARTIKLSSHVITTNRYLTDFAMRYNHSVSIIPTPIDTDKFYPDTAEGHNDKVVIGWMGSITSLPLLNPMKNVFTCLSKRFNHVRFKIVGGEFSVNGLSTVISKQWSLEEEKDDLRSFDIGIMPMPDNEWMKGKCGFKGTVYMGMGIPCICSPVGMNTEIITDGVNGLLASTQDEWIEKLSHLIKDAGLRKKLGMAGRKTIEDKYSLKVNAPKFLELFNKVYDNRHKKRGVS